MDTTVEEVAERLREAAREGPECYTEALADLWADEVQASHDPPMDEDGIRARPRMNELNRGATARMRTMMADLSYKDIELRVNGDEIEFNAQLHGTNADGTTSLIPLQWIYTVERGTITKVLSVITQNPPRTQDTE